MTSPSPSVSSNDTTKNAPGKHGKPRFSDPYPLSFFCRQIYVVAGQGPQQMAFSIPWSVAVLITDVCDTRMRCDGNLYFQDWDPAVVKGILFSLLSRTKGESHLIPRWRFWAQNKDVNYFVKFYLLAAALKMEWACEQALRALDRLGLNGESLRSVIGTEDFEKLQSNHHFAEWMAGNRPRKPRDEKPPLDTDSFAVRSGASLLIEVLLDRIRELEEDVGRKEDAIRQLEEILKAKQSREEAIRAMLKESEPERLPSRPR
ncbi:hypothetical protein VTI74DRAFT_2360 [Chaetomium olivicolor]